MSNSVLITAHHQVPPGVKGQQEAHAAAPRDGQVSALPNSGRDPLPSCQLGAPQGSGEQQHCSLSLFHSMHFILAIRWAVSQSISHMESFHT